LTTGVTAAKALAIANELRSAVEALRFHFAARRCASRSPAASPTCAPGIRRDRLSIARTLPLYRAKREGKNLCIAA